MDDMQAWLAKNQPNEHHAHLAKSVGDWKVAGKFWMQPGQPPMESEGTSKVTAVLDGRYVQHEYDSSFMGQPFRGLGLDGYDTVKEAYVSTWVDSMSTGIMFMQGQREGEVMTAFGECPGMGGGTRKLKSVTVSSDEGMVFSMFDEVEGEWQKSMELTYTRP